MSLAVAELRNKFRASPRLLATDAQAAGRVDFVDFGKGICIILVVMMHSTLGVGNAVGSQGWMHLPVEFSRPFRMPDFFLLAGLFLAKTIDAPWRRYIDRKVIHFFYFYLLWTAIHLTMKVGALPDPSLLGLIKAFGWALLEPITPLWFIYLLPIFFIVTRLLKPVPWPVVIVAAGLMEAFHVTNHGMIAYEFTYRFVYFYAGYRFAPLIFSFARTVAANPALALAGLALWAVVNGLAVFRFSVGGEPLAQYPGVGLILGFAGAFAIVAIAVLLSRFRTMGFLSSLGERSLIVFTAFVVFMAPVRILLLKTNVVTDVGTISFMVMAAALIGPLILYAIIRRTPLWFLFERPKWARLKNA